MRYGFYLFIYLLFTSLCSSQTFSLTGNVQDPDGNPLEAATVYLTSVKDSTLIEYTITNKNGGWELKTKKIEQPVYLKVSYVSFVDHKQELKSVLENKDFGTIKMEDKTNELDAVVIEGEIPPIRIKQDTLEFNASSFKVRPDANVEALLKQLPGIAIDSDGKITHNGKPVNEILVNGKPFFDTDGKMALKSLPAEMIDKVQLSDTKTKAEKISGQNSNGENASINLTIKKDMNKGLFGKLTAGYGTNERYETSGLLNYFKDKRKLSFLASSNNINSSGFSQDELFDNMGRMGSSWISSGGSYSLNGMYFGANRGITITNTAGLNYSDELLKDFEVSGSYSYTGARTENENRTKEISLLPQTTDTEGNLINNNFTTESTSRSDSEQFTHNFNTDFEVKPDSTSTLSFVPRFNFGSMVSRNNSMETSRDENGQLLNESDGSTFDKTDNASFTGRMYYFKSITKKGRSIGVTFNNENRKNDGISLNQSTTAFYEDTDNDGIDDTTLDVRDQKRFNRQTNDSYNGGVEYFEPLTDSLKLKISVDYNWRQSLDERVGYDYDAITQDYTALNELLSNHLVTTTKTTTPTAGINVAKKKYYMNLDLGTSFTTFDNFSRYLGTDYSLTKNYALPKARMYFNYRVSKTKNMSLSYNLNTSFPGARQLLPVVDVSNPLYTITGNPDLDPTLTHNISASYRNFDYSSKSGYSVYTGASIYQDQVVGYTLIDPSAKRTTTYRNISGAYNMYLGLNWNKSFKKEAHNFRLNLGLNSNYGLQKGFTNSELYEATSYGITPNAGLTYEYGELLTISPSYQFTYDEQNYTSYNLNSTSNVVHRFNLQTTSYWPKHVVFGNDFAYTYNSNIAPGFKRDFYLWNTSLGYNFLDDKLLCKVKVYDVLNQNLGTSRTISATSITDQENIVLKRYVMFSLTFKIERFGGKEALDKNRSRRFR